MRSFRVFVLLCILLLSAVSFGQGKPATPFKVGPTLNFTLEGKETRDLAIPLAKTTYYLEIDLRLCEGKQTNIQMEIDLLKTNGAIVKTSIIRANEIHVVDRIATTLRIDTAATYRLRIKNGKVPMDYWIRMVPLTTAKFTPFPYDDADLKPLGIGTENGKGGVLEGINTSPWYQYHTITLQPGKYNMSVYMKSAEGNRTNLQSKLEMFDNMGVYSSQWVLNMNEIDVEARIEKLLVITKPRTVIFRISNQNSHQMEYIIGIEKA